MYQASIYEDITNNTGNISKKLVLKTVSKHLPSFCHKMAYVSNKTRNYISHVGKNESKTIQEAKSHL